MASSEQGIGLLGGSFDPVHNGHIAIAKSFLESGFISELWILLTPDPPHKTEKAINDYEHRLEMLRAAFQNMDHVIVTDIEKELPRPSYTIQTLQYLHKKYPEAKFYLCLGEDSIYDFKTWKDWQQILEYCELLVARRPSNQERGLNADLAKKTHFVSHNSVEVSSTKVRNFIARGKDISTLVPEEVNKIIEDKNLYRKG